MKEFSDKHLTFWTITYNSDPNGVFVAHSFEQVISSVECSIRGYVIEDSYLIDDLITHMVLDLNPLEHVQCIPIIYNTLRIMINRWDLDNKSHLHKLLSECYQQVDNSLKNKIKNLYTVIED